MGRKIKQLTNVGGILHALCEDNTVWRLYEEWHRLVGVPEQGEAGESHPTTFKWSLEEAWSRGICPACSGDTLVGDKDANFLYVAACTECQLRFGKRDAASPLVQLP